MIVAALLIVGGLVILGGGERASADINTDLKGYWRFDTNANDFSGNGNNGTLVGGAATTGASASVPGDGASLSVDGGDDYVSVPDISTLDITAGSWAAWIKFDAKPSDAGHPMNPVAKQEQYWIHGSLNGEVAGEDDAIQAKVNVGGTRYIATTAANFISTGVWYHVAGTYDGDTLRLYIDGDLVNENTAPSGAIQNTSNILAIGTWSTPVDFFDGLVDEVRVYSRVLTQQEIKVIAGLGTVTLSPDGDINAINTSHTVTAEVDVDGANATEAYTMNFKVTSGPNASDSGEVDTGTAGAVDDADFTYTGDGGPGTDDVAAWIDIDLDDQIDSGEPASAVTKTWYDGVASGGGAIVDDSGATKRKDWRHISFGGAVYRIGSSDYDVIGEWETVFHNTSVPGINGKTFTASTIHKVVFAGTSGEATRIVASGTLDGVPGYVLVVRAEDAGEPGSHCAATDPPSSCDNIRFSLFSGVAPSAEESTACGNVYDTSNATLGASCTFDTTNEGGDFPDQSDFFGKERTFLDSGNLQIATLP